MRPAAGRLERMRWWHLEQVLTIERAAYGDEGWSPATFWGELGQVETRHYVIAVDGADAEEEPDVVGFAGLCDYPDEAWVQTIAVAPSHRRRGLADLLLSALLEEAGRRRQRTVSLEVRAGNDVAQRLYSRHGFVRTGLRRAYYQPSGEDAVVMTRRSSVSR